MTVTAAQPTFVQIAGNGSATVFAAPMKCFQASDVLVGFIVAGVYGPQLSGFAVTNVDVNGGFSVVFTTPPPVGTTVDIRTATPQTQTTEFANLGQYFPENTTEAFDRLTRSLQDIYRQVYQFGVHGPDTEGTAWPALPPAAQRLGGVLSFDATFGLPTIGIPNTQLITTALLAGFLGLSQTAGEATAGVIPVNPQYGLEPRRYGGIGSGTVDDSAAVATWATVVNATTNPVSTWPAGLTFLTGAIPTITAANFTWNMYATILVKPNSWGTTSGTSTNHVSIAGSGCRLQWLRINGNQSAFTGSAPFGNLLSITGNDVLMDGCSLTQSPAGIMILNNVAHGKFVDCHCDNNANTVQIYGCSYLKFTSCTFNLNGYTFGTTVVPGVPIMGNGFAVAIRYRSHHITFVNCDASQSCSDGFNVNQGSYAIKFIGCLAWMCGDGGFTIAADNTGTGRPGEGESCYDLEYVDCEAYNNWGCGLVAYAICYNVTIDGGRYYNNHRLAGAIAEPGSLAFMSGIYFSGGCLGLRVRTKSYDDRQLCPITAASGSGPYVVTATGWVPGTMGNYPRVVVLNAAGTFAGYANITAESAGSVTITASAFGGIGGSPVSGQFISQRVQHNGDVYDNGCQATSDIDAFGFLPGTYSFSGYKTMSGFTAGGQNVLIAGPLDYTELLANPTWDAGTGSGSTWTYALPGSGAANAYTTINANVRSPGALQLVGGSSAATGDAVLITDGASYAQGTFVEASVWVNAVASGDASVALQWNGGTALATVVQHPGGGYKELKVGGFIPGGGSTLNIRVSSAATKTNYFDNATLRAKSVGYDNRDASWPTRNLPT